MRVSPWVLGSLGLVKILSRKSTFLQPTLVVALTVDKYLYHKMMIFFLIISCEFRHIINQFFLVAAHQAAQ